MDEKKYPISPMRRATVKLIERLKDGNPGDKVTDEELKIVCGKETSVKGDGYPYLCTAIRHCRRVYGRNWERIPKAGAIQCLDAVASFDSVDRDRRAMHRKSRTALQKLKNSSNENLDPKLLPELHLRLAQIGVIASTSSSAATKRIAAMGLAKTKTDLGKLLEGLRKPKKDGEE